jgi:hypothetical protein
VFYTLWKFGIESLAHIAHYSGRPSSFILYNDSIYMVIFPLISRDYYKMIDCHFPSINVLYLPGMRSKGRRVLSSKHERDLGNCRRLHFNITMQYTARFNGPCSDSTTMAHFFKSCIGILKWWKKAWVMLFPGICHENKA